VITDVKTTVRAALIANAALIGLLGGPRIYQFKAPNASEQPRIDFFEVVNRDSEFADNQSIGSEVVVQISIFSLGSTSAIAGEVDRTMKSLGYFRTSAVDQFESDSSLFHKAMRYRTNIQEFYL